MRRTMIFALIALLIVIVMLDFQTAGHEPPITRNAMMLPTVTPLAVAAAQTRIVITATPVTPVPTALPVIEELPPGAVESLLVTLTAMANATPATPLANDAVTTSGHPDDLNITRPLMEPQPIGPTAINNIEYSTFLTLDATVQARVRQIYTYGQTLGNNPRAFSMLGDSTIEYPHFLARFDSSDYNLGDYAYLQAAINYFTGSFGRRSVAIRRGLHTWSVLDPMWAPKPTCFGGEHMLACEFRLNRPSLLFIRLGANDAGIPETTEENFRRIVEFAIDSGVIPILGTKADLRASGQINNKIMRRVAADYQIPLMDYALIAQTLPGQGLVGDGVHMTTFFSHDYTSPVAFQRGYSTHNLAALITLDLLWRTLTEPAS